jgi:hypothetical protein
LINPFKIDVEKMNCAGSSYCQIIGWSLTMNFFWDPSEIFKLLGMIETLFTYLWSCGCLRWRWWWIYSHGCELENMFLILTSEIIQTLLRRTFDGGSLEDSMDDREVDSR